MHRSHALAQNNTILTILCYKECTLDSAVRIFCVTPAMDVPDELLPTAYHNNKMGNITVIKKNQSGNNLQQMVGYHSFYFKIIHILLNVHCTCTW